MKRFARSALSLALELAVAAAVVYAACALMRAYTEQVRRSAAALEEAAKPAPNGEQYRGLSPEDAAERIKAGESQFIEKP